MANLKPYLTDEELAEICRPLIQGAAQIRYLRDVLHLPVARRLDGTPLVKRADWDRATQPASAPQAGPGPNWRKAT